jgi:hypothetical protein
VLNRFSVDIDDGAAPDVGDDPCWR